jgi:hypothetical protein
MSMIRLLILEMSQCQTPCFVKSTNLHIHSPPLPTIASLVILRRQLIIDIPHQTDPHLRRVVPPQLVRHKVRLDLHLDHLERAAQHATQQVAVPQLVLRAAVVGELDEVGERVLVEDEAELLVVGGPVGDGGGGVEEDFEADLSQGVCQHEVWLGVHDAVREKKGWAGREWENVP